MTPKTRTTLFRLVDRPGRRRISVAAVAMVMLCLVSEVQAQLIWDGGGANNNWSTAANWNNNIAPGNPSGTVLQFGGNTRLSPNVDAAWNVNGIQFNNGAGAFTIGGSAITIATTSGVVNNDNSTQTISAPLVLNSAGTAFNAASANLTMSGVISGSGGITKSGNNTLTLSGTGANTYSGTTTINAGTLTLGKSANVVAVAGAITIGDGSGTDTLRTNAAGQIASTSAITFTSGGSPTFNLNNNAQSVGSISSTNTSAAITLGSATLTTGGDNTSTSFSGLVSGTGGLTKSGNGTQTLDNGASSYSGITTISGGTLAVGTLANGGSNSSIGASSNAAASVVINGGTLRYTGAAVTSNRLFTLGTSGGTFDASGSGLLTLSNTGSVALSGTNTARTLTLTGTGSGSVAAVIGNNGSGATAVTKNGTGTWTLANAANTYTGVTTINGGTLSVGTLANGGSNSSIGASSNAAANLVLGGGSLQYTGANATTNRSFTLTNATASSVDVTTNTLTMSGSSASTTGSLTKLGAGGLTLSGTNLHSGGTTLSAGTLNLNSATAPGSGTLTINGGTLNNTSGGSVTLSNNNVQTWGGDFTFTGSNDLNLGTGAVTLSGGNRQVTVSGGTLTAGGTVSGAGLNLTKAGVGTLVMSGNIQTTTGTVTVNAGTLTLSGSTNNFSGGTTLASGATLNLNSATAPGSGTLTINGGTLNNTSGGSVTLSNNNAQTWGGDFTFTGSNALNLGTGAVTLGADRQVTVSASTLTVGGAISGSGGLTKAGAGTLVFGGSNAQTGTTTLSAGTLTVNSGASLSGSSAALVVNGGTLNLNNSAQTVSSLSGSGGTVNLGASHTLTVNTTGTPSFSGAISSTDATSTLVKSGSGSLTLSGTNTYTGAVSVTAGTLLAGSNTALGAGTSASHSVSSGASLALSGSGLNVNTNGSSISIAGDGVSTKGAIYNVSGTNTLDLGNSPSGGSISLTSAARLGSEAGTLVIGDTRPSFTHPGGHSVPNESGFITLGNSSVSNNLTFSGSGNITVNARIRDYSGQTVGTSFVNSSTINYQPVAPTTTTGTVTVNMGTNSSTVTFAANGNSYTGTTYVTRGTLVLDTLNNNNVAPHDTTNDSFHAINGNLVIGNGGGTATVQFSTSPGFGPHEPLAISTGVTLYSDGTLNLNGNTQTINTLTFVNGGTVNVGNNGTLYLNNSVNFTPTSTGNVSATIGTADGQRGSLSLELKRNSPVDDALPAVDRQFTVSNFDGSSTSTLTVNSVVKAGSVTKLGDGVLVFAGGGTISTNNTYTGTTTVSAGILRGTAGTAGSYSSFGSGDGSDAMGTTVANGATVQLSGGINVSSEKLNLNGNGYNSAGALQNLSGNNTWGTAGNSYINLVTDSRINADSGTTLTIPTNISSTGNNKALTVGGSGDTTITGSINTGSGSTTTLTKDGTGTLILSGSSGYQGKTDITAGIVRAASNGALGAGSVGTDGTFVTDGAQLQLSGGISLGDTMSINGTGSGGTGAIRNYAGSNSIAGAVTFATTARVYNDVASNTLTLAGGLKTSGSSGIDMNFAGSQNITVSGDSGTGSGGAASGKTIDAGSSTLTKGNTGTDTGTLSLTLTGTTNQVGQVHMNYGGIAVNSGQLNTAEFDSLGSTTLTIGAGAAVVANYASGTTIFSGAISASGASATFQKTGAGTLVFGSTFDAGSDSVLKLSGGTLKLGNTTGVSVTFGTIHITADTTIDFNGSYTTTLTSLALIIDAGVNVSVINWTSLVDAWYVNGVGAPTINSANFATLGDQAGVTPLNQITFGTPVNAPSSATTWVSTQGGMYFNREIRPTPEPATYGAIFLGGCLALLGYRRYRRSAARR